MFKKLAIVVLCVVVVSTLAGCGSSKPLAESWALPKKENADSAMIIGYMGYPNNKKENPDNNVLFLWQVNFMTKDKAVYFGNGEPSFVLDNNYFVIPNLKPGKYYLNSFRAGKLFNQMPIYDEKYAIELKPGQIKFFGSFDFLEYEGGFIGARSYKFNIRQAGAPSEQEMFQWLSRVGAGSGWEAAINRRLRELGGRT